MAATKAGTTGRVNDFLRGKLEQGDTQLGGVFVLRGPAPALRYVVLALVWTLIPIPLLRMWKFQYLVVTRNAVLVIDISKATLSPKHIAATYPRADTRIECRADNGWNRLTLADPAGTETRYHVSPSFHRDLQRFLDMYHPPIAGW